MGVERRVHRVLVGKPERKRPLGRLRRRWEDSIKKYLQEVGGGRGDWMELAQDRDGWRALVSTVKNFRVITITVTSNPTTSFPSKINKSWGVCGWQKNWIGKG
jgi:hypothetical protein